jgi:hypothetical protein
MKSVLNSGKKVGFKPLPCDTGTCITEEKKMEDTEDPKNAALVTPTSASNHNKQASTPSTCSPASSAASPPLSASNNTTNKSQGNFRKKFRFPRYFFGRRRGAANSSSSSNQSEHSEDEELAQAGESDDPVMAVFQSRYKNRVRWALDDQPVAEEYSPPQKKEETTDDNITPAGENDNAAPMEGALDSGLNPPPSKTSNTSSSNIKKFVKGALFGSGTRTAASDKEFQQEVAKEVEAEKDLVWESNNDSGEGGEVLYTSHRKNAAGQAEHNDQFLISFTEKPKTRAAILKLIKKGRRAQTVYYRYDYAVKYFVRALDMLTAEKYPDKHPTVRKTLEELNEAHHKLSSFNNSANVSAASGFSINGMLMLLTLCSISFFHFAYEKIVKIGIKYEDSGELVRALKMYSIA